VFFFFGNSHQFTLPIKSQLTQFLNAQQAAKLLGMGVLHSGLPWAHILKAKFHT